MAIHKLFISYSHKDENEKKELEKWLIPLRDSGRISIFSDSEVVGGKELIQEIDSHLCESDIVILLLSQDFLTSNACKKEMEYAFINEKSKIILPIVLKSCTWKQSLCQRKKALPKDGLPIENWQPINTGWLNVYEGIEGVLNDIDQVFQVKEEYLSDILKVEFVHENKKNLTLDDIFVFPFLSTNAKPFEKEIVDEDYFFKNYEISTLVIGRDFSGKTSFLRKLFISYSNQFPTILLDGSFIYKTKDFKELIKDSFEKEFSGDFKKWFDKKDKVALIDNFHHGISENFIEFIRNNFQKIIVAMSDEEFIVYFKDDKNFSSFQILNIDQFPMAKQEELIIKWVQIGEVETSIETIDYQKVDTIENKINNIVSTNRIVPRFPFYILTIMQSLELFMPSNFEITSFGHCYQALIVAQLIKKGMGTDQIDTCFNFLQELAFKIFQHKSLQKPFYLQDYSEFKKEYKEIYIISDSVLGRLEDDEYSIINNNSDGIVSFSLEYFYLFFLGKYFSEKNNWDSINSIIERINIRQNALILIFIVHHTKNRELLETILLHCMCSFDNIKPAELTTSETQFMSNLLNELPYTIASGKSIEENRKKVNAHKDKNFDDRKEDDVSLDEINKGLRIIEVLGQILKNRAGSFEKSNVQEILEHTIDLGLRIMNLFLGTCRKPEFVDYLVSQLEEEEKENTSSHKFSRDKKKELVEKNIQIFGYMITVGMINRITYAISSDKLTDEAAILSDKRNTPAYQIIDYLLCQLEKGIDVNKLEKTYSGFEKSKNFWAKRTLSYYVQSYLNTHRLPFKKRQKTYNILGITKYIPNKI